MINFRDGLLVTMLVITWLAGIVLAKGVWSTLSAVFFFPYAWYLIIEKVMITLGII